MEFILYRLIQLSKRELQIIEELCSILCAQGRHLNSGQFINEINVVIKEKRLWSEIQEIKRDQEDEYFQLAQHLKVEKYQPSYKPLLEQIQLQTPDSNHLVQALCEDLLVLINRVETTNEMLQKYFNIEQEFEKTRIERIEDIDPLRFFHFEKLHRRHYLSKVSMLN